MKNLAICKSYHSTSGICSLLGFELTTLISYAWQDQLKFPVVCRPDCPVSYDEEYQKYREGVHQPSITSKDAKTPRKGAPAISYKQPSVDPSLLSSIPRDCRLDRPVFKRVGIAKVACTDHVKRPPPPPCSAIKWKIYYSTSALRLPPVPLHSLPPDRSREHYA
jgi:hypothetical protein